MKKNKIEVFVILVFSLISAFSITEITNIKYFVSDENKKEENKFIENIAYEETNDIIQINYNWQIYIPKLDLLAPISDGTEKEVLKTFIGHVRQTSYFVGNICLAAHNNTANYRYGNYYFDRLDELDIGDEVYYTYDEFNLRFKVSEIKEVYETDMSCLEDSLNTKLTLITCIAGKREKRLIVICNLV